MKLHHYAETDSLYIELNERPGADAREVGVGVVLDVDEYGAPAGIDIEGASRRIDLKTLELVALPATTTRLAE
jgi:uncharacterized protein YuzE